MIATTHLFPVLDQKLIELLESLTPAEWNHRTVAKLWTVKDVAAHLLDGNFRTISMLRDGHSAPPDREIHSYTDLVAFLNDLNADWVKASKRLSPQVLTELLKSTGKQYSELIAKEDLNADAPFSVAWAGEAVSKNWFHIAREYTEKWHHQQQIREATGRQGILTPELFLPFIETLLQGLPHTYRNTPASEGTTVRISIELDGIFNWFLVKTENKWVLTKEFSGLAEAGISLDAGTAWKLFTKALKPEEAAGRADFEGNKELAMVTLNLIAVMA